MAKVLDVANFFIDIANTAEDDCITNLRVNKLLYFAQAWSLVRLGKPLFEEDFQAWKFGPVVPSIYQEFKDYGKNNIDSVKGDYSIDSFTEDELDLLMDVLREYGQYSSPALVDITHGVGTPWAKVFKDRANNVISKESMEDYFEKKEPLKSFYDNIAEGEFVGYRDPEDGLLVLPADMDDAE